MKLLEYKLTNDILFKMLFVNHEGLLKKLVAVLLATPLESITKFKLTNPEIPPESLGEKFCRLDINMDTSKNSQKARIFSYSSYTNPQGMRVCKCNRF